VQERKPHKRDKEEEKERKRGRKNGKKKEIEVNVKLLYTSGELEV
jgi:hypothetical protein